MLQITVKELSGVTTTTDKRQRATPERIWPATKIANPSHHIGSLYDLTSSVLPRRASSFRSAFLSKISPTFEKTQEVSSITTPRAGTLPVESPSSIAFGT